MIRRTTRPEGAPAAAGVKRLRRGARAGWLLAAAAALLLGCRQQEVDTEEDAAADTIGALDTAPEASDDAASVPDTVLEPPDTAAVDTASMSGAADGSKAGETATASAQGAPDTASVAPAPAPSDREAPEAVDASPASRVAAAPPAPAPPPPAAPASAAPAPAAVAAPADTPSTEGAQAAGQQGGQASLQATDAQYNGWKQFSANCERCHGQDAVGSSFAPSLVRAVTQSSIATGKPLTEDLFVETVTNGRLEKGMPAWKDLLSADQITDMWEYLSARASGQLAPGRPTRAGG